MTLFGCACIVVQCTCYLNGCINQRDSNRTDFREIWYWGLLWEICRENTYLVKNGQKYRALYVTSQVYHSHDIRGATINTTHCCISAARLSKFLVNGDNNCCISMAVMVTQTGYNVTFYVYCPCWWFFSVRRCYCGSNNSGRNSPHPGTLQFIIHYSCYHSALYNHVS